MDNTFFLSWNLQNFPRNYRCSFSSSRCKSTRCTQQSQFPSFFPSHLTHLQNSSPFCDRPDEKRRRIPFNQPTAFVWRAFIEQCQMVCSHQPTKRRARRIVPATITITMLLFLSPRSTKRGVVRPGALLFLFLSLSISVRSLSFLGNETFSSQNGKKQLKWFPN